MNQELLEIKKNVLEDLELFINRGKMNGVNISELSIGGGGYTPFGAGMVIISTAKTQFCYYTGEYPDGLIRPLESAYTFIEDTFQAFQHDLDYMEDYIPEEYYEDPVKYIKECISFTDQYPWESIIELLSWSDYKPVEGFNPFGE